jgi:glycosyl transferase family 2
MPKPFISVLIDTYNHERFIEPAISSVLEQDIAEADREIIVVDDGSTDRTPEIVRKFEPKVRLIRKANGGQASAFNTGIPECSGEIIAFLDGDDWWTSGKLQAVGDVLAGDAKIGLVGHGIIEAFSNGARRALAPEKDERFTLDSVEAARVFRLRKSYLGTSRMTLRAGLARHILPVPEALVIEADEYLFTIAAAMSEIVILRNTLTNYHIHGGNLFVAAGGGEAGLRRKYKVMEALAKALCATLSEKDTPPEIVACIVELIQAEADQLRLMLDGGTPWETVKTETTLYRILHGDAGMPQRIFRNASMVPAMILPPRWFYAARQWLGSHPQYHRVREKVLPVPKITHAAGPDEYKA